MSRILVPHYWYPDPADSGTQNYLVTGDPTPRYIVINDRSGALAGQSADSNYTTWISSHISAGHKLLYYVDTNYAARSTAAVEADMDAWVTLYGAPDGWFFDRASAAAADLTYYQGLYTHAAGKKVVLNHGTTPDETYISTSGVCDISVIAETDATTLAGWTWPSWLPDYPRTRFAVITYSASDLAAIWAAIANHNVGSIYVTDQSGYATLATYWSSEISLASTFPGSLDNTSPSSGTATLHLTITTAEPGQVFDTFVVGDVATSTETSLSGSVTFDDTGRAVFTFTLPGLAPNAYYVYGFGPANPYDSTYATFTVTTGGPTGTFGLTGGGALTWTGGPDTTTDLQLRLRETTLTVSPGSLIATLANGTPDATATFACTGSTAATTTAALDAAGTAGAVSVPINVATAGTYTLSVTDGTATVTAAFTVAFISTPGGFVMPTITPPAAVQNTVGVKKWVLQDPAGTDVYHFPYNPNEMTSPFGPKNITYQATTAIDGNKLAWEGQEAVVSWQFSGFLRTQAEYDGFVYWRNKHNRIWVTDHYGRAWLGYITSFDPKPRRSMGVPWAHDYSITFLIFHGPVTPA